jgi:hypothetical protein
VEDDVVVVLLVLRCRVFAMRDATASLADVDTAENSPIEAAAVLVGDAAPLEDDVLLVSGGDDDDGLKYSAEDDDDDDDKVAAALGTGFIGENAAAVLDGTVRTAANTNAAENDRFMVNVRIVMMEIVKSGYGSRYGRWGSL